MFSPVPPIDVTNQPTLGGGAPLSLYTPIAPIDQLTLRVAVLERQNHFLTTRVAQLETALWTSWSMRLQVWLTTWWVRLFRG